MSSVTGDKAVLDTLRYQIWLKKHRLECAQQKRSHQMKMAELEKELEIQKVWADNIDKEVDVDDTEVSEN